MTSSPLKDFSSEYAGSDWTGELHVGAAYKITQLSHSVCVTDFCFHVVVGALVVVVKIHIFFGYAIVIFGKRGKGGCRSREGEDIR